MFRIGGRATSIVSTRCESPTSFWFSSKGATLGVAFTSGVTPGKIQKQKIESGRTTMRYSQPPFKVGSCPYKIVHEPVTELSFGFRGKGLSTHVGRVRRGGVLRPVNPYRDLAGGGAEFLVKSAVGPDPHVFLRYLHLQLNSINVIGDVSSCKMLILYRC